MTWHGILVGALVLFLSLGCGQNTPFLHVIPPASTQTYEKIHPLKQLVGENRVDILWVVDNSLSMEKHQVNLGKNVNLFISEFVAKGGLQWKMGVISTSIAEDPYVGLTVSTPLNSGMKDAVPIFRKTMARLGVNGDPIEKSFAPVLTKLGRHTDFLRKDATLAIVFVSDAEEQSDISGSDFLKRLRALKGSNSAKIITYGVLAPIHFRCESMGETPWQYLGSPFEEVITPTKGKLYKLCGDFGQNLSDMAKDLVTRVDSPYIALANRPSKDSIRVTYKGKDLPGGPAEDGGYWTYDFDRNRVVFHNLNFAPNDNEEVTLSYTY